MRRLVFRPSLVDLCWKIVAFPALMNYLGMGTNKTRLAVSKGNLWVQSQQVAPHMATRAFPLSVRAQSWRHHPTAPTTSST